METLRARSFAAAQDDSVRAFFRSLFNNLSHGEAAELAGIIKPNVAIPCHYDMFPDNAADPQLFRAALKFKAPDVRYNSLNM